MGNLSKKKNSVTRMSGLMLVKKVCDKMKSCGFRVGTSGNKTTAIGQGTGKMKGKKGKMTQSRQEERRAELHSNGERKNRSRRKFERK
jgi:hypothetical protein